MLSGTHHTLLIAAVAAALIACGQGELTTQTYLGSASYAGVSTGASPADVVVFGFPQYCNYPQGPCVGAELTITALANCSLQGRVLSIAEDHGDLQGFTAEVYPDQSCTLGSGVVAVTGGTLTSTFSTLALSISGNVTEPDAGPSGYLMWTFQGHSD